MRISILLTTFFLASCAGQISAPPLPSLASLPARGVSDCRLPTPAPTESLDVAIVIDASRSTMAPSGWDVDLDGRTGKLEKSDLTDVGDSLLVAEVAGVKSLLLNTANLDVRFSVISFEGLHNYPFQHLPEGTVLGAARIQAGLTEDTAVLEAALDRVLERGSSGRTNFTAGMREAIWSLRETPSPPNSRRRLVLFMSDSPTPVQAAPNEHAARRDFRMQHAARKALRKGIVFNTFGLGRAAAAPAPHTLSRIAGATGGTYRAVEDPTSLHCHLLSSLLP